MADLVVTDLAALVTDLDVLISEFEGALDLEDDNDDIWGQLNANLSMGDFADNWTSNRNDMVEAMKKFRENVREVNDAWTEADRKLSESLVQQE
jgi:2-hydroxy-3-keto-5-methylthiopentenyl-1-phosphate phosphatase